MIDQNSHYLIRCSHCRIDSKTEAEAETNRANVEIQADVEVLQQKLDDANASTAQLQEELSAERANGVKLEEVLQLNEEQHERDAHTVKLTILGLQRALMDKVNQADRLALQVEAVLKKSMQFENLIAVAKDTANDARQQAEYHSAQLSSENMQLSVSIDKMKNKLAGIEDQLARSHQRNAQLEAANKDLKGAGTFHACFILINSSLSHIFFVLRG